MTRKIIATLFICLLVGFGNVQISSAHTTHSTHHTATVLWYQPLLQIPHSWMPAIKCLMMAESRSTTAHPNLGDNRSPAIGQYSGIFQMGNYVGGVWDTYAMPRLHVQIWNATPYQQAEGFVDVLRYDGGFHPWHGDGCIYPN